MKLIVGLGNPGADYELTRHNVGFDVVDLLARRNDVRFKKPWLSPGLTATVNVSGESAILLKPTTFMNLSGNAVEPLARKKKIPAEDVVVVFDDVDLDAGEVKIRHKGGAGGHNGMKSIIQRLGTQDFPRVRVGVGPRPKGAALTKFVLGRWPSSQRGVIDEACERSADAVELILARGVNAAMNQFN